MIDYARDFISTYPFQNNRAILEHLEMLGFRVLGVDQAKQRREVRPINEMKGKYVTLLLSLLEGEADYDIIERISQNLAFPVFKARMKEVFKFFLYELFQVKTERDNIIATTHLATINNYLKEDSFDNAVAEGFDIYILFNTLADYNAEARQQIEPDSFDRDTDAKKAYDFFKANSAYIELSIDGKL